MCIRPKSTTTTLSSTNDSDILPNGIPRMKSIIGIGLTILCSIYFSIYYIYKDSSASIFGIFPPPSSEYCSTSTSDSTNANTNTNNTYCSRSDLFAFQIASGVAIYICGILGFITWHIRQRHLKAIPQTAVGRLFGYIPEAEYIAAFNLTFQLWDFCISLLIPEHCTIIMLLHHAAAATVSYCSIRYTVLHYYGIYFLACTEISSIFLAAADLAKFFPPAPNTLYDQYINIIAKPGFVFAFLIYRVLLWWPISIQLFRDVYEVIKSGQVNKIRPGCSWVLYIFLIINIPLGILQLYWLTIVIDESMKFLFPPGTVA